MRKFLLIILLFVYKNAFCQLNDKFDDGDFTQNPAWSAGNASADFVVDNGQLRSDSESAKSNFYLSTPSSMAMNCQWEFDVNLKFATSGANYTDIYLVSDVADLKSADVYGYFIRIGDTDDEISLYKRNGSLASSIKLIDGADHVVSGSSNNLYKIRVSRLSDGTFTLERDAGATGSNFVSEGSVKDDTFTTSSYFGIYIQQSTQSFFKKHFFDNFLIQQIVPDSTPPELTGVKVEARTIQLTFSEDLNPSTANIATNYRVDPGHLVPVNASVSGNRVSLTFAEEFQTGNFTVSASSIEDNQGNQVTAPLYLSFNYKRPYLAKYKDIVINEIFADPSPRVELPGAEFVELWNTTAEDISLKNFVYKDQLSAFTFSDDTIKANSYLILCAKSDTSDYKVYGNTLGISPWPSLNNSGDVLCLLNANNEMIDEVAYSETWYADEEKKAGGYTLEMIDPDNLCQSFQNYGASRDSSGGTPGKQNSIYQENRSSLPLTALSVSLEDSVTIRINFSRSIDSLQATLPEHYFINNGLGVPQAIRVLAPQFMSAELIYPQSLTKNTQYTLTIDGVSDCGTQEVSNQQLYFLVPGEAQKGDVLISEILFNPRPGGVDFLEIYNASDQFFDFKDLRISGLDTEKDSLISEKQLSTISKLFLPGTYWVITTDSNNIKQSYFVKHPDQFVQLSSMPSFNDDKGVAIILNAQNQRLDQFNYEAEMHFPLLKDVEGISLERVYMHEDANKPGNFRSATAGAGYATPTYKNSQEANMDALDEEGISLSSATFSPDNDGFEDALVIQYKLAEENMVANLTIYDDLGRKVKKLVSNENISSEGSWIWDGLNDDNQKISPGIYVIYAELFDLQANIKKFKKTVVVANKF